MNKPLLKRKRMTALQSAPLYARLIVDEYKGREPFPVGGIAGPTSKFIYRRFIVDHRHIHPCYELAIRQIEGR